MNNNRGYSDQTAHMATTLGGTLFRVIAAIIAHTNLNPAVPASTMLDLAADLDWWQQVAWRAADHLTGGDVLAPGRGLNERIAGAARAWVAAADAARAYVTLGAAPWRAVAFERAVEQLENLLDRVDAEARAGAQA